MSDLFDRLEVALGDTYRLGRELGGGGMSRVFLAEEIDLGREVVIKVLPPDLAAGVSKERFEREIRLAAGLQDPLIVPILRAGSAGSDLLYYVMPFITGESLRERLDREGRLPVDEAVRIFRDVADALAHAHAASVVHRDIKPDNVMLAGKHAVVTDFGVAKAASVSQEAAGASLTQLGMAVGTPMYMAPEQAAGDPNTDHRADIYSLGVVAYEMLAGRLPFEATTPQGYLAAHVSRKPDAVGRYRPGVPAPLAAAVMRCLAKRPSDRWQSADELSSALEGVLGSSGGLSSASLRVGAFLETGPPARVIPAVLAAGLLISALGYALVLQLGMPNWVTYMTIGVTAAAALGAAALSLRRSGSRGPSWMLLRRGMAAGYGLLGLSAAVYMAMRMLGIGPVGTLMAAGVMEQRDRVLLVEFENHTADSTLAETVTELLRVDLAQSPALTLLEPAQVASVLRRMQRDPATALDRTLALEVAERGGVKAVLAGEVRSVAGEFVVSATLLATATGETLAAARETAAEGRLIAAVDRLSAVVRGRIGESLRTIRADAPLADVTTSSTQALRKYAQAGRANNLGDVQRAIGLLEEAITIDSTFAMAHRKLAVLLNNVDRDRDRARQASTRAYELRDRLTERERYLAEAAYHDFVGADRDEAERTYATLLERYPNDRTALNNLALAHGAKGRWAEAERLYRRSIGNGGAPAVTFANAIMAQFNLGMADSADATFARFQREHPDHPALLGLPVSLAAARFDFGAAAEQLAVWKDRQDGSAATGLQIAVTETSLAAIQGAVRRGVRAFLEAYDLQERAGIRAMPQPRGVIVPVVEAMFTSLFYGEHADATRALDRMRAAANYASLPADQRDDLNLAAIYARAGRTDTARELVEAYRRDAGLDQQTDWPADVWAAYAGISVAERRFDDAIAELQGAREQSTECSTCFLPELGEALVLAGRTDSAVAVLERFFSTSVLYRLQTDAFTLWAAHIRLGEAYELAGRPREAIDQYQRLLDLWADADPELDGRKDDLRSRIARLGAAGG